MTDNHSGHLGVIEMNPIVTLARTAEFLYYNSEYCKTGNALLDLTDEQTASVMEMAGHLLVHAGIFNEEWLAPGALLDTATDGALSDAIDLLAKIIKTREN